MALKQAALNFDFPAEEGDKPEKTPAPKPSSKKQAVENAAEDDPIVLEDAVVYKSPKAKSAAATDGAKKTRGRMKLSDMNASAELVDVPEDAILFEKRYYSIGAVSDMFKVNQSLIRFWENEFTILKPKKNGKGDRFFRPEDVKNLKLIYHLLRERKYTIEGAKEFLKKNKNADKKFEMIESLKDLRSFLVELKANL